MGESNPTLRQVVLVLFLDSYRMLNSDDTGSDSTARPLITLACWHALAIFWVVILIGYASSLVLP